MKYNSLESISSQDLGVAYFGHTLISLYSQKEYSNTYLIQDDNEGCKIAAQKETSTMMHSRITSPNSPKH